MKEETTPKPANIRENVFLSEKKTVLWYKCNWGRSTTECMGAANTALKER